MATEAPEHGEILGAEVARLPAHQRKSGDFRYESMLSKSMSESHFLKRLVWLTLAVALACGVGTTEGQEPKVEYAQEYYQAFKGGPSNPQDLKPFGPDNERCVKFEPEGLRITLPAGYPGSRPTTGVATGFGIKGDFELTIAFEILAEPDAKDAGAQTRFTLAVNLDRPNPYENQATLSRRIAASKGPQYLTWLTRWDGQPSKKTQNSNVFPVSRKTGRFQLARTGADISYLVAEGDDPDFKRLTTFAYGDEDVRDITITASTGSATAALDVRVFDLRVKAAGFPKTGPIKTIDLPAPPQKSYAKEYFQSFTGSAAQRSGWDFEGPEAENCVRFEPGGLRIHLPPGWDGERKGTGLRSEFQVKGDFEITLDYEILKEPTAEEVGKIGTRLSLAIFKDTENFSAATISRAFSNKGEPIIVTWQHVWNDAAAKHDPAKSNVYPTKAKKGRLRLVRVGAYLYLGLADGLDADFQFKSKYLFGMEDLRNLRVIGSTGSVTAMLDARVTNLRVRADAIPNAPTSAPAPGAADGAGDPPAPRPKGWLMAGLVIGTLILLLAGGLGAGLFLLRRRVMPSSRARIPEKAKKERT